MNNRVLVLMATHNGIKWVAEQVESIRAQEGVEVSILASDDASKDGTFEYLNAKTDLILLENRGPYGSAGKNFFNLLLRADFSGYDFVAFSDQDDIWHPLKLSRSIASMVLHGCQGYSANVTTFWDDGREIVINKAQPQRKFDFLFESASAGCTYVISPVLAKGIQEFLYANPDISEKVSLHDWFVYAWARSKGFHWFIDKKPSMRYRQHDGNAVGANNGLKVALRRIAAVKSGWYRDQVETIAKALNIYEQKLIYAVLSKSLKGRLRLAVHARKFRRDRRDALVLAINSLMGWF